MVAGVDVVHSGLMTGVRALITLGTAVAVLGACRDSEARSTSGTASALPTVIDSAMSIEDALARFREGLPPVAGLGGGRADRDSLIVRFVRAVERTDTATIRTLVVDRAEFAYLYYPGSAYSRPPTLQVAGLAWFLHLAESQKGITRAFDRFGGRPMGYLRHACEPTPRQDGRFRAWDRCLLTLREEDGTVATRRLFGSIVELDGRFKFLSYGNDF